MVPLAGLFYYFIFPCLGAFGDRIRFYGFCCVVACLPSMRSSGGCHTEPRKRNQLNIYLPACLSDVSTQCRLAPIGKIGYSRRAVSHSIPIYVAVLWWWRSAGPILICDWIASIHRLPATIKVSNINGMRLSASRLRTSPNPYPIQAPATFIWKKGVMFCFSLTVNYCFEKYIFFIFL